MERFLAVGLVLVASCNAHSAPPSIPMVPPKPDPEWTSLLAPDPERPGVDVRPFDVTPTDPVVITSKQCETVFVIVTYQTMKIGDDVLYENDIAVFKRLRSVRVEADRQSYGVVVRTPLDEATCGDWVASAPKIVRHESTPEVHSPDGAMIVWPDVGPDVSKTTYIGRVEFAAPVREHVIQDSWEVVVGLRGTLVEDWPNDVSLETGEIKWIEPGMKRAWSPGPGATPQIVQILFPRPPGRPSDHFGRGAS